MLEGTGTSDFKSQTDYTQIYHWIKIQAQDSTYHDAVELEIKPKKTIDVNYRIEVPESAPGGSQHACIFVETIPEDTKDTNGIMTVSRAAVKVFANVSGEIKNDAEIINLNTDTLVLTGKVVASTAVKNIGNIDIKPTLTLKINTLGGDTVFEDTKVAMVFPENSSEIMVAWPETPSFGIYNLIASVNVLGKRIIEEKTIVILPLWFTFLLPFLLVFVVVTMFRFYKARVAKKNRDIIIG